MTNIEKLKSEIAQMQEFYKNEVTNRILGIAALKSLINDASGETQLIKKATEKLNTAFNMENYYLGRIEEFTKQLNELLSEEDKLKEKAKDTLGLGGNV